MTGYGLYLGLLYIQIPAAYFPQGNKLPMPFFHLSPSCPHPGCNYLFAITFLYKRGKKFWTHGVLSPKPSVLSDCLLNLCKLTAFAVSLGSIFKPSTKLTLNQYFSTSLPISFFTKLFAIAFHYSGGTTLEKLLTISIIHPIQKFEGWYQVSPLSPLLHGDSFVTLSLSYLSILLIHLPP